MAKLSNISLWALKGSKELRQKVAGVSGVTERTVYRWIADNHVNLTTASVLDVLKKETGLDEELLERSEALASAK
jgi:hypothetical protein